MVGMTTKLFRYSGSKSRLLKILPPPDSDTIVEPFAGSAAYGAHYRPKRLVLAEKNPRLRALWNWLRSDATTDDLSDLERIQFEDKTDARALGLSLPQETLLRLTTSGAYVGQLSSWTLYRQHKVNFAPLREALPWLKSAVPEVAADFRDVVSEPGFHFIDPPYLNTSANYVDPKEKCDAVALVEVLAYAAKVRGLLTYGDDAPDVMPSLEWTLGKTVLVPNLRRGGTKPRREHYSVLKGA